MALTERCHLACMSWDKIRAILLSHELFIGFLILFTAGVLGLLIYLQFFQ